MKQPESQIRSATEFFDELQAEIEDIKAGRLGLEEAREVSKYRGHQVKTAVVASQNMRFAARTKQDVPLLEAAHKATPNLSEVETLKALVNQLSDKLAKLEGKSETAAPAETQAAATA